MTNHDERRAMNRATERAALLQRLRELSAGEAVIVMPPEVELLSAGPPGRSREEARRRRQIVRGLLVVTGLLASGCAPLFGPSSLTVPPPEALSAAVVSSYPFVVRACLELGTAREDRALCVAGAREALSRALEVHDEAIDAELAETVGPGEGMVTR